MIEEIFTHIEKGLTKEGKFVIRGFGTFWLVGRKKGDSYNGFTGVRNKIIFKKRVRFIPSVNLKNRICK